MITNILNIIAQTNSAPTDSAAVTADQPFWDGFSILICAIGLAILTLWLIHFGGPQALRRTPVRRTHWLFPVWPLSLILIWLILMMTVSTIIFTVFKDSSESFQEIITYPALGLLEVSLIIAMLIIARRTFARRLKGFGLNPVTLHKDAAFALVNLLAVYPLILIALWAVLEIGKLIKGADFAVEAHQSLGLLAESESIGLRIMIAGFAVFIVPVFEELLFRGFLQTSLRSLTGRPWLAIIITSLIFATLHPPMHIPSLIALSCCLGYAYERSGSLLRPILIHIFFNAMSIAATLLAP